MKSPNSIFLGILCSLLLYSDLNGQTLPIMNAGFEHTNCPVAPVSPPSCQFPEIISYFENGCLSLLRSEGCYRAIRHPAYMHSGCAPDYNAYQGDFFVLYLVLLMEAMVRVLQSSTNFQMLSLKQIHLMLSILIT